MNSDFEGFGHKQVGSDPNWYLGDGASDMIIYDVF